MMSNENLVDENLEIISKVQQLNECLQCENSQLNCEIQQLNEKMQMLTTRLDSFVTPSPVKKHIDLTINVTSPEDVSLTIFKSLPEFSGEREKYATWRSVTRTAIKLLDEHKQSMRYFEALMVIRNKITGVASNVLNNYNQCN